MRRAGPALLPLLLAGCSLFGGSPQPPQSLRVTAGPSASPSGPLLRALWVLSPLGLSLRDAPDASGKLLAHIPQGNQVTATAFQAGSRGWYKVEYQGAIGWIAAKDPGSIPPQDLVTPHPQLSYANPDAGYYFLYAATWTVVEHGSDVEAQSPAPGGATPTAIPSNAPLQPGVTPLKLIVHLAKDIDQLGKTPTTPGSLLDTTQFEVGGITAIKRIYTLSGGGVEGDAKVKYSPDHAVLITFRGAVQADLDAFTEILESFGFSIQAKPSASA